MKTSKSDRQHGVVYETVMAIIIALITSLVLILIAAFCIKQFNLNESVTPIINQIIKCVSIFLGCICALKQPKNGWVRGMCVGFIYVWLAYVVFSLLAGEFKVGLSMLNDAALGTVFGLVSGIIAVNLRKPSVA